MRASRELLEIQENFESYKRALSAKELLERAIELKRSRVHLLCLFKSFREQNFKVSETKTFVFYKNLIPNKTIIWKTSPTQSGERVKYQLLSLNIHCEDRVIARL